jgi:phage shock protein PspC (stress-responsive transcriptional regulator)
MKSENETMETATIETEVIKIDRNGPADDVTETVDGSANANGEAKANPRTLYRSPTNKFVAGVCGGVGDFLGIDATLVRIAWIILTLITGGGGVLAYIALWALLPVGTRTEGQIQPAAIQLNDKTLARTAYLLIALGGLWFLANVGILPSLWSAAWSVLGVLFWPALLIGAGWLLLRNSGRNWRGDVDGVTSKVRASTDGKVPSSDQMRNSFASARQSFPLKRSTDDRIALGVCGGIGEWLGIDANLVRLIWAALSVGSIGLGVVVYVALGLLLPQEGPADVAKRAAEPQDVIIVDGSVSK